MAFYVARISLEVKVEAYGVGDATATVDGVYTQLNSDGWDIQDFVIDDLECVELYCSVCYDSLDPDEYDDTENVTCQHCLEEEGEDNNGDEQD